MHACMVTLSQGSPQRASKVKSANAFHHARVRHAFEYVLNAFRATVDVIALPLYMNSVIYRVQRARPIRIYARPHLCGWGLAR